MFNTCLAHFKGEKSTVLWVHHSPQCVPFLLQLTAEIRTCQDRSPLEVFDATVDQLTQHGLMVSRADSLCPWGPLSENWVPIPEI